MKILLSDLFAGIVFLVVLLVSKEIAWAVGVAIAVGAIQMTIALARGDRIDPMQWMSLVLIVGLGGATLLTRNPLFVMMKPTLLEGGAGCIMLRPGWMLRYLPERARVHIPRRMIVTMGFVFAGTMFVLAAVNIVVALRAQPAVWAAYVAIVPAIVLSLVGGMGYLIFRRAVVRAIRTQTSASRASGLPAE